MSMARVMPAQRPGRSEQTVATPREFLDAVERRFGEIGWDLAATSKNNVVKGDLQTHNYFGPDHREAHYRDSLIDGWSHLETVSDDELHWLNPPYSKIAPWAEKCAEERQEGVRIALLVPASVGSAWYTEHVEPHAYVFALSPRLTFVGHKTPYPKDLILAMYEPAGYRGFETWRWRK